MSSVKIEFETANKPDNFPSAEEILNQWKTRLALAKAADSGGDIRGVSLVDSASQPYAWLKFGSNVTMAEARTQHYVAQVVNGNAAAPVRVPYVYFAFKRGVRGLIVMEFVDGDAPSYSDRDVADAAAAVQFLANIKAPNLVPGPINGGQVQHPFFRDGESPVPYPTVDWLQLHVNNASFAICFAIPWLINLLVTYSKNRSCNSHMREGSVLST
jgi:hypothetical protein